MRRTFVILALVCGGQSWAQEVNPQFVRSPSSNGFPSYYLIEEPKADLQGLQTPLEMFQVAAFQIADLAASLLAWNHENQAWPAPTEHYDRLKQFGTWLGGRDFPACQNTRAKVLLRDTEADVTLSANRCTVKTGKWHDPYTGNDYAQADAIQIDHVVPLANAYISGADNWNQKTRCAYANFMANNFHLLSVDGHQNQSKGDSSPADWMPPNAEFHCQYLKDWLSIKLIWGLVMSPPESDAIKAAYAAGHCDPNAFTISADELKVQRQAITTAMAACPD